MTGQVVQLFSSAEPSEDNTQPQDDVNSDAGGGGGGGPTDEMKDRIEKLEAGHATIIEKLNAIATKLEVMDAKLDAKADKAGVASLEGKVTSVKDAIDTRASQAELNLLKGSVTSLPTTTQLIVFAIAIFTAAGITRLFGH